MSGEHPFKPASDQLSLFFNSASASLRKISLMALRISLMALGASLSSPTLQNASPRYHQPCFLSLYLQVKTCPVEIEASAPPCHLSEMKLYRPIFFFYLKKSALHFDFYFSKIACGQIFILFYGSSGKISPFSSLQLNTRKVNACPLLFYSLRKTTLNWIPCTLNGLILCF